MERHDEKGRLAMEEKNYGDHNKIEAQLTPLLALLCTVFGIPIRKAGSKRTWPKHGLEQVKMRRS